MEDATHSFPRHFADKLAPVDEALIAFIDGINVSALV
jgi:hypothetical protein